MKTNVLSQAEVGRGPLSSAPSPVEMTNKTTPGDVLTGDADYSSFGTQEPNLVWTISTFLCLLLAAIILLTIFLCFIRKRCPVCNCRRKRQRRGKVKSFLSPSAEDDVNEDDFLLKKDSRPFPTGDLFFPTDRLADVTAAELSSKTSTPLPEPSTSKPQPTMIKTKTNLRDSAILFPSLSTLNGATSGGTDSPRMSISSVEPSRDSPDFSRVAAQLRKQSMRASAAIQQSPISPVPSSAHQHNSPESPTFFAAEVYEREYRRRRAMAVSLQSYPSSLLRSSDGSESERSAY